MLSEASWTVGKNSTPSSANPKTPSLDFIGPFWPDASCSRDPCAGSLPSQPGRCPSAVIVSPGEWHLPVTRLQRITLAKGTPRSLETRRGW